MKENINEYNNLRAELLYYIQEQRNYLISMYIIVISIFAFTIQAQKPYFFLLAYVVIIPFGVTIKRCRESVIKISQFIIVFFEENNYDMNWESLQNYVEIQNFVKMRNPRIMTFILRSAITQLGCLTTGLFLLNEWDILRINGVVEIKSIVLSIISIVLLIITIYINANIRVCEQKRIKRILYHYRRSIMLKKDK